MTHFTCFATTRRLILGESTYTLYTLHDNFQQAQLASERLGSWYLVVALTNDEIEQDCYQYNSQATRAAAKELLDNGSVVNPVGVWHTVTLYRHNKELHALTGYDALTRTLQLRDQPEYTNSIIVLW